MAKMDEFTGLLKGFREAMFASADNERGLHARPMHILRVDPDGSLWFATGRTAAKVKECEGHPETTLVTLQSGKTFVSLTGTSTIVQDPTVARLLWSELELRPWFPGGPDDPNLCFLKFTPKWGEYWDYSGVVRRLSLLYQEGKAYFTGEHPDPEKAGRHEKITLQTGAATSAQVSS